MTADALKWSARQVDKLAVGNSEVPGIPSSNDTPIKAISGTLFFAGDLVDYNAQFNEVQTYRRKDGLTIDDAFVLTFAHRLPFARSFMAYNELEYGTSLGAYDFGQDLSTAGGISRVVMILGDVQSAAATLVTGAFELAPAFGGSSVAATTVAADTADAYTLSLTDSPGAAVENALPYADPSRIPVGISSLSPEELITARIQSAHDVSMLNSQGFIPIDEVTASDAALYGPRMGQVTAATQNEVGLGMVNGKYYLNMGDVTSVDLSVFDKPIAHTHPSGVLELSPEDIKAFGIDFPELDAHVLVAPNGASRVVPLK